MSNKALKGHLSHRIRYQPPKSHVIEKITRMTTFSISVAYVLHC